MKLEKAIELLEKIQMDDLPLPRHEEWQAAQLGKEAMKRVRDIRTGYKSYAPDLLPGETKE
ncbi:hypothetical protein ES705_44911 [subsurface metagenome]